MMIYNEQVSCRFLTFILKFIFGISIFSFLLQPGFAYQKITPTRNQALQSIKIIQALENAHYLKKKLNNKMSSQIFNQYLKRLDPRKNLFTLKDIESFKKYEFRFDDELKRGRLDIAFSIFNLYLDRSKQRSEFIISIIPGWEKEFDFEKNDSLIIENEIRQWQKDKNTLLSLWHDELKNHIITLILDDKTSEKITTTLEKLYLNRLKRLQQTETDDIFQIFINVVAASFDPHTQYFPPRASEDFDIHMSLSLEGIGAVLQTDYEYTKVVRLIPKGPADKSTLLMPGDKIIGVGQGKTGEIVDTIGQRIDHVVKLIRGPKNTIVRLKIIPAKKSTSTKTIQIKRDRVKLEEQSAKKNIISINHNNQIFKIGIIEIPNFYIDFKAYNKGDKNYKSTTKDVKKILLSLKKEKIDGLIVDLRNNGGGALQEANQLTGLFLKTGPTVQIKYQRKITRLYDDDPKIVYTGPMIVMMNRMSASASEIFAGAIKDYHRGIVVGSRSFGKGTVQELLKVNDGRLKLTRAKFYRVSGESTQHLGILPDLNFPRIYNIDDTGESSLENALPWDTIVRSLYTAYPKLNVIIRQLNEKYKLRAAGEPGLNYLEKRIQMMSDLDSQKRLSLNLNKRKQRQSEIEQLELDIENQYRSAIGKSSLKNLLDEKNKLTDLKEILMDQAHLVMADYIILTQKDRFFW